MKVIIVTGMSGSGKSKALNIFEDSGYYCLDNLPVKILPEFIDMVLQMDDFPQKLCITMDARNRNLSVEALKAISRIGSKVRLRILYLDCEDGVLLKRYKESRRLHPLMMYDDKLDLPSAIAEERHMLEELRQRADMVVDTSLLSTGDLREKITELLPDSEKAALQLSFIAFGYKYGIPSDCDLVFDVRCLPNPYYIEELRDKTGNDQEVRDFVMSYTESQKLLERIEAYLDTAIPLYEHEGKVQLVVGLGCTGGQHRSLTFAILLAEYYAAKGYGTHASARDSRKNLNRYR